VSGYLPELAVEYRNREYNVRLAVLEQGIAGKVSRVHLLILDENLVGNVHLPQLNVRI
jgi:hypothetical protein